ncbi:Cysteine-rich secretory protein family protein [compost metagenome]
MLRTDLTTASSGGTTGSTTKPTTPSNPGTTIGDANERLVLTLINQERAKAGLPALTMDANLLRIARIKAQEMVDKNYFSHTSPTYGTPFKMMQSNGITYKTAGENIAGNPSVEGAVKAWMNSEGHRKNILSNAYNYIGVGVVKSDVYGYMLVTMFVGR